MIDNVHNSDPFFIFDRSNKHRTQKSTSIFPVVEDFHVFFLVSLEGGFHLSGGKNICVFATQKVAAAVFLDQFCSAVTR